MRFISLGEFRVQPSDVRRFLCREYVYCAMNSLCQLLMNLQSELQQRLEESFADAEIDISVSGNHATLNVNSEQFEGLNRVQRQQRIYACINDLIRSGDLHAVVINTSTPAES